MKITLSCLLLIGVLLTASVGAGESGNICHNVDVGRYANLNFCLPSTVSVQAGTSTEGSFSLGRYAATTVLVGGKNVAVYLLYPCSAPSTGLTEQNVQTMVEALMPNMKSPGSTIYYTSTNPVQISGQSAVWGSTNNNGVMQTFAAYEPATNVVEAIFFDGSLSADVTTSFLQSLQSSLDLSATPIRAGDCAAVATTPVAAVTPVYTPVYYWPYWKYDRHRHHNVSPIPIKPIHVMS